ncbi:MAG: hypothetical protein JNK05_00915 [Myxococcales bacterium]|nr:hypothetical protein [Myxococcales bacterium]
MSQRHLQPCVECGRHVRASENACPFCGASVAPTPAPMMPQSRLSRAALVAFGLAVSTASCGGGDANANTGGTVTQGGSTSSGGEGPSTGGGVDQDAGSPVSTEDASATSDASVTPPEDTGAVVAMYGAPVARYGAPANRYGSPPANDFV